MATFLIWICVLSVFTIKIIHSQPNVDVTFRMDSITEYTALLTWEASVITDSLLYSLSIEPNGPTFDTSDGEGIVFKSEGSTLITGLRPGELYSITVTFVGESDTQDVRVEPFNADPLAPTSLTIDTTTTTMLIEWETPESVISEYRLEYTVKGITDWVTTSVDGVDTTAIISGLVPGQHYTVRIFGISGSKESPVPITVDAIMVPVITAIITEDVDDTRPNEVVITYTEETENGVFDEYIFSINAEGEITIFTKHKFDTDRVVVFSGLKAGYLYTITARTRSGDQQSAEKTIQVLTDPLAPTSLTINTTTTTMLIEWETPESVISEYRLEYTMKGITDWVTTSVDGVKTSAVISGLVPGQHYTVRIFGISGSKESPAPITVDAIMVPVITAKITEDVDDTRTNEIVITYTEETGNGVFDEYIFSINTEGQITTFTKHKLDTDRVVVFSGLSPGYLYTITARTHSGDQQSAEKIIQVLTVPGKATVSCYGVQSDELTIAIQRPMGGITHYMIECVGLNCEALRIISPSGDSVTTVTYQSLVPFNSYTFKVSVIYKNGSHEKIGVKYWCTCSTVESAPEEVASFDLDVDGYDIILTWTEPIVKNGRIRNYTLTYVGTKENAPIIEESGTISSQNSWCESQYSYTFTNLPIGYKYVFTIRAVTIIAGWPRDIHYFFIREPNIGDVYLDNPEAMKPVVNTAPSTTELSVSLVNPFTDINGDIVGYSMIVSTSTTQPGNDSTLLNWSEAKAVSFKKPYMAIYNCSDLFDKNSDCVHAATQVRRKRAAGDRIDIEIGADKQCAQDSEDYCNGELEPHSAYFIILRAYTETGLYSDTPFSDAMITAQPETASITTAIVASVLSFVVGGALVGLIVFFVFRSRGRSASQDDPKSNPTDETIEYEIASENVAGTKSVQQKATGKVPYGEIPIKPNSTEDAKSKYMSLDKPIYYENMVDDSSEYYNNPKQSTTKEPAQYQELQYKK